MSDEVVEQRVSNLDVATDNLRRIGAALASAHEAKDAAEAALVTAQKDLEFLEPQLKWIEVTVLRCALNPEWPTTRWEA